MSDETNENLRAVYQQLCNSYHAIDDFRARLLGFLPLATGTGIFLLVGPLSNQTQQYLGPIGAFGVAITLGLFCYELYGINTNLRSNRYSSNEDHTPWNGDIHINWNADWYKKCHHLIEVGKYLEGGRFLTLKKLFTGEHNPLVFGSVR